MLAGAWIAAVVALVVGAARPAASADTTLTVLHVDGRPASGATVMWFSDDGRVISVETDAAGVVRAGQPRTDDPVVVIGACWGAQQFELDGRAEQVLRLEGDGVTEWAVRVNGSEPPGPVALYLDSRPRWGSMFERPALTQSLEPDVARALEEHFGDERVPRWFRTNGDGRFLMTGMPRDDRLWIRFADPYRNQDGKSGQSLDRESERIELDLVGPFQCFGRVVDARDGSPLANHRVRLVSDVVAPDRTINDAIERSAGWTDAEGRFAIELRSHAFRDAVGGGARPVEDGVRRVRVAVDGTDELGPRIFEVPGRRPRRGRSVDLGELELRPVAPLRIRVVDGSGGAIEGARVVSGDAYASEPSGADGIVELTLSDGSPDLLQATAPGFATRRLSAVLDRSEEPTVVMEPRSELEIRLQEPPPPGSALAVQVWLDGVQGARTRNWEIRGIDLEAPQGLELVSFWNTRDGCQLLLFGVDPSLETRLATQAPGMRARVYLLDAAGGVLATASRVSVGDAATQRFEMPSVGGLQTLRGRLVDGHGAAWAGRSVFLVPVVPFRTVLEGACNFVQTDSAGEFSFDGVPLGRYELRVPWDGAPEAPIPSVELDFDGSEHLGELVVERP